MTPIIYYLGWTLMALIATYEYRTAQGRLAFFKDRFDPKRFQYRLPNGKSQKNSDGLPNLLYRLPELIAADLTKTVFIAEGEKDCDALAELGLVVTCNFDGAGRGKWQSNYRRNFRGRNVVVFPDNDWPGQDHAEEIARSLTNMANSVKIVLLPDLPKKGDVSDWLAQGGTRAALLKLCHAAPIWRPRIELEHVKDQWWADESLRLAVERIFNRDLKPQEKLVLIVLEAKIGKPRPTQKTLARAVGVSCERLKKILADMRRRQLIAIRKRGRENVYSVGR